MNQFDDILSTEPIQVTAGNTWSWKRDDLVTDYPTADYALSYVFRLEGHPVSETVTAAEVSSEYVVTVTAAQSIDWTAGKYRWTAQITRTSDNARISVDDGVMEVLADPATAETDPRSHAQIVLDNVQAVIEGTASKNVQSYSINGRSLSKYSMEELLTLKNHYQTLVNAEKAADRAKRGKSSGRNRVVNFY